MKQRSHTTHVISVLFYDIFYLQITVSPSKIALGGILLKKVNMNSTKKHFLGTAAVL